VTSRKRWLQFRLRSLLLVMLAGCIVARFGPAVWELAFPLDVPLPGPFYGPEDDIQYFAPGPEFKLSREAAAQKPYQIEKEKAQAHEAILCADAPATRE
jgi:hypothetical protein